jgi:hypothetical protein
VSSHCRCFLSCVVIWRLRIVDQVWSPLLIICCIKVLQGSGDQSIAGDLVTSAPPGQFGSLSVGIVLRFELYLLVTLDEGSPHGNGTNLFHDNALWRLLQDTLAAAGRILFHIYSYSEALSSVAWSIFLLQVLSDIITGRLSIGAQGLTPLLLGTCRSAFLEKYLLHS